MEQKDNLAVKLLAVQTELKVPKNQFNSFGKYSYRNAEDIVEAVKPLVNKYGILLTLSDSLDIAEGRVYIKSTAKVMNTEAPNEFIEVTAYAREPESKKGMDESQITGTATSYARKYALNGLFAIDDTKDADNGISNPDDKTANNKNEAKCSICGTNIPAKKGKDGILRSSEEVAKACNGLCIKCYKMKQKNG